MIFIKKICVVLLLLTSMICGVLMFLLGTNMGTYLIFTGIRHCIPGLTFDSVSGNWGNFNITHVVYATSIGIIDVDKCNIFLNLKYILSKQIYINHLFLENVCIKNKKNDMTNKRHKKYKRINIDNIFFLMFPVTLKNVVLQNVRINLNNNVFKLKEVDTGLIFQDNLLTFLPTNIKGAVLKFFDVNISNIDPNMIGMHRYVDQWNTKNLLKSFSNKLSITLPTFNIPININLEDVKGNNFCIFDNNHNYYIIDDFCLQTYLCNQFASIKLNVTLPDGYLNARANIMLKEYYPINIVVNYTWCNTTNIIRNSVNIDNKDTRKIQLVISGELYNEICLVFDFLGVISTVHVLLKTKIMQFGTPINISIVGRKIPLYFLGKNDYLIEEIDLRLNGEIRSYCIQGTSLLSSAKFPLARIVMNANGDIDGCAISKLRVTVLDEYLDIQGVINWRDMISWNSICVLNKINFSQKWLKRPIKLSGNITMQGHVCSKTWDITVSDLNLNGIIGDQNISCIGALYSNSTGTWKIPMLLMKWGSNILEVKEELKKDSVFNITLAAPDCNVIASGLTGSVYGKFKLYGPVRYPIRPTISSRLQLSINAYSLCWRDRNLNIEKIIVNGDIFGNSITQSKIFFQADKIRYGILSFHQLIMRGQGNIKKHYLKFMAYGDMLSGQVKLCGNLDFFHKTWHSRIDKTSIVTSIGTWKLMQDIVLTYQYLARKIIVDTHYWEIIDCVIPVANILKTNTLNKVNDLFKSCNAGALEILLLPELIKIHSARVYCMNCHWILGTLLPRGTISFIGKQLNIKPAIAEAGVDPMNINNITTKIIFTQATTYCKWLMNIENDDHNHGLFRITTLDNTSKITGYVQVQNVSLVSFCNSLISLKEPLNGLLNLNIHFYAHKHRLKIYGIAQLQNFNCNKPDTPFFFKNGQVFMRFFGDHAVLNGVIDTDNGCKLYLNGKIINFDSVSSMRAFFKIRGNQVNFCISPEIKMKISPDITCTITSEKIHIHGNVVIPWAYIKVKENLKNIVGISSEEILLDDNFKPILDNSKNLSISVSSNVNVYLGNDVNFNGLGLCSKLRGNLEIGYDKNHLVLTGHIGILSGHFQVYGQNLIVKKGQLLFSGAINQPYIDIEVICDPSDIKNRGIAGMRITGIFGQLKIETFSNLSSISQRKVISYALGGIRNIIFFNTDTNIVTSLLIGASVRNSEKFINKIGKIFGVQDLTLNTQDIIVAPLVALSGYIAPGLQIKYGVSIFDLLATITIRYSLCSQFYLEVTSGNNQAIDVLYKFDF